MATTYTCKECNAEVKVSENGEVERTCEHNDAGIDAHIQAVAYGQSKVK